MFRDGRKPGRMNNLNKMAANKTLEEKKNARNGSQKYLYKKNGLFELIGSLKSEFVYS